MVVSVSSKSFLPESKKNSYQVHRIEPQHGKQPRTPALGCRPALTLASANSSSVTSELSPGGQALADYLMGGQTNSLNMGIELSKPPADSAVGSKTVLPTGPVDGKSFSCLKGFVWRRITGS